MQRLLDERRPLFEEKYANLPERWRVDEGLVSYIIRLYTKKLERALSLLVQGKRIKLSRFFADSRTDAEYIYDLIDGWLIEDVICDAWLKTRLEKVNPQIKVKHMGTNRDREIQFESAQKITTKPDFIYETPSGREVHLELQMARQKMTVFDMKESKVKRAIRDGNTIYLWILLPSDEYFFLDPKIFEEKDAHSNPRWGGKKVYSISLEEVKLRRWGLFPLRGDLSKEVWYLLGLNE
ncbi:hypothetical protein CW714_02475 [Methanophagales archaeon]|nr:MAG: hypothetical protein CW714_02475 [Methanophagales archaeon]